MKRALIFLALAIATTAPAALAQQEPQLPKNGAEAAALMNQCVQTGDALEKARSAAGEEESLKLAIPLLRLCYIEESVEYDRTYQAWSPERQRDEAYSALIDFNAMDEFQRKVQDYYKENPKDYAYNKLMADSFVAQKKMEAAVPFLEQAHLARPNDPNVTHALLSYYYVHNSDAFMALVESIFHDHLFIQEPFTEIAQEIVHVYERAGKLDHLVQLYRDDVKNNQGKLVEDGSIGPGSLHLTGVLLEALKKEGRDADVLEIYQGTQKPLSSQPFASLVQLGALYRQHGDRDRLGEVCEAILFNDALASELSFKARPNRLMYGSHPVDLQQELIRVAREAGQINRLKKHAEADNSGPDKSVYTETSLAQVLVFGHDPDTLTFLPGYLKDAIADPDVHTGRGAYVALYGMFDELVRWPEGRSLAKPVLQAAVQIESESQPPVFIESGAVRSQLALTIGDEAEQQAILQHALVDFAVIYAPPGYSGPAPRLIVQKLTDESLGKYGVALVEAGLRDEANAIISLLTDSTKSIQARFPDSQADKLAEIGQAALDAGYTPTAKLAAEAALKSLQAEWQNPAQTTNGYYSVTIDAPAIHDTCELLLRLGLKDDVQQLGNLLTQPGYATSLNLKSAVADVARLQAMLGGDPHGLTPVAWVMPATASGTTRKVYWDLAAMGSSDANGHSDFSFGNPTAGVTVEGRSFSHLDGKLTLQVQAGPTVDDMRLVKTVSAASSRGSCDVTLMPGDQFMRATCQTPDAQPRIFEGPVFSIGMAENLISTPFHVSLFSFDIFTPNVKPTPLPLVTDDAITTATLPGGPEVNGNYQRVVCPSNFARLELIGPSLPIVSGDTYLQSGWLRGSAQWGVRYLDAKGQTISDSLIYLQGERDWHRAQQTIKTDAEPGHPSNLVPSNAVALEPILVFQQTNTLDYQDLYFGIVQQKTPPTDELATVIRKDLVGATSIAESPQGGILAVGFNDGSVRCFEARDGHEVGSAGKLGGPITDISFVNNGQEVIACDGTNVLQRPVQGTDAGRVIFHAPWKIDILSSSIAAKRVAIGNRAQAHVVIFNSDNGLPIMQIDGKSEPTFGDRQLTSLLLSSDGTMVFFRDYQNQGVFVESDTGKSLNINPQYPQEIALAHFFHIPHTLKIGDDQHSVWLQVDSGVVVNSDGSALNYSMMRVPTPFKSFPTGLLGAFCLSAQNSDVYAITADGALKIWKLPDSLKIPPFIPEPEISLASPPAATAPGISSLTLLLPQRLRGFPGTTLSQKLALTVLGADRTPVANARVELKCDLNNATFKSESSDENTDFDSSITVQTDATGKASVLVHMGNKTGQGTIALTATKDDVTAQGTVPIEVIDEKVSVPPPTNITVTWQGEAIVVRWTDPPDDRTCFIVERQSANSGEWRQIAILPEEATSCVDNKVMSGAVYNYRVTATNESKYGYPAKLPPPPDRLDSFLPFPM